MAQHTHVMRLYESLKKNVGEKEADAFLKAFPLSKSADYKRKFRWAEEVCAYLENTYTEAEIQKIRMDCSCLPSENELARAKQIYLESPDMDTFITNYNKAYAGTRTIWLENGKLYFSYPTCYCACVKRVNKTLPKTWCLCSIGYTKKLFDSLFEKETEVVLLESIKLGSKRCVMEIKYQ